MEILVAESNDEFIKKTIEGFFNEENLSNNRKGRKIYIFNYYRPVLYLFLFFSLDSY
jgi:hypothetical protein